MPITVTEIIIVKKLRKIGASQPGDPDDLPNWVLKEFAKILVPTITEILNTSFRQREVPSVWKLTDVSPLPKSPTISDFNINFRPNSLTLTLSKVAESIIIERELKPTMPTSTDPCQFGFIPGSLSI